MAKTGPVPQPGILEINAYVPGESSVPGGVTPIKLSSNETPLGPSPKAIAAYKAVADELAPLPGRRARPRCATPSPSNTGSTPTASSAAAAPTS